MKRYKPGVPVARRRARINPKKQRVRRQRKRRSRARSQPRRPFVWQGCFRPIDNDGDATGNHDLDVAVQPFVLCSNCIPIRSWLEKLSNEPSLPGQRVYKIISHHTTGSALDRSSVLGCHLCTLLWQSLFPRDYLDRVGQLYKPEEMKDLLQGDLDQIHSARNIEIVISKIASTIAPSMAPSLFLDAQLQTSDGVMASETISVKIGSVTPPNSRTAACSVFTASKAQFQLAFEWMDECHRSHRGCRPANVDPPFYPTRLIDLGPASENPCPRLITTAQEMTSGSYLALSYCWGNTRVFKLTASTCEALRSGVPVNNFATTIQHAFLITKGLGFRYIWIDSLCIFQDSVDDWEREAASMADVYSNCFLTLAALGANSSNKGFFAKRDPLQLLPCWLFKNKRGEDVFAYPNGYLVDALFSNAALHRRGWVVQERLLSPRTLNFGSELVWECREQLLDEFGLVESRTYNLKDRFATWQYQFTKSISIAEPWPDLDDFSRFWNGLLRSYTSAQLSVETDRLIALSGIIHSIRGITGWKNIAGLWEPCMLYQLLWRRTGPGHRIANGMPSWSWASIGSPVCSDLGNGGLLLAAIVSAHGRPSARPLKRLATVDGVEVTSQGLESDTKTKARQHLVRITGTLMEMENVGPEKASADFILPSWPPTEDHKFTIDVDPICPGPYYLLPCLAQERQEMKAGEEERGAERREQATEQGKAQVYGLAVAPSPTVGGAYERVGYVEACIVPGHCMPLEAARLQRISLV